VRLPGASPLLIANNWYNFAGQTAYMDKLVFATNNQHKVDEIRLVLGDSFDIVTLKEAGIDIDIPEPHDTLEANATEKSTTIHRLTGGSCFSEDTGLEVEALGGEPGVKSARYAGEDRSFEANIDKLLQKLEGQANRRARFRTVVSLILDGQEYLFEGVCEGHIATERSGSGGFGYDPVFVPTGGQSTFAEMSMEAKNQYSHRRKAVDKLVFFLKQRADNQ
jgi:XTP/dITP diphosphohydrolase